MTLIEFGAMLRATFLTPDDVAFAQHLSDEAELRILGGYGPYAGDAAERREIPDAPEADDYLREPDTREAERFRLECERDRRLGDDQSR